jgi:hypothetical protein
MYVVVLSLNTHDDEVLVRRVYFWRVRNESYTNLSPYVSSRSATGEPLNEFQ